jgi:hypothetical protein
MKDMMNFRVVGTEIWYFDRIFARGLRCIPKDEQFFLKIAQSRNKFPDSLKTMFNLSEAEKKEYDETAPKGEDALAEVIIKDCRKKGLILLSREKT